LPLLARLSGSTLPPLTAVLGSCPDGRPVAVRLGAPAGGRLLLLGDDGAGKSALLHTIVMSVALSNRQRQVQFALLDPRGSLAPLANLPHLLTPRVRDPLVALDLLRFLNGREGQDASYPRVVVLADDLQDWWRVLAQEWIELAGVGQELGVTMVGAVAPPFGDAALELEWGADLWLAGRLAAEDDREAAGLGDLPLEALGTGTFYALTARDEARFQSAFISSRRVSMLAEQLWDSSGAGLLPRAPVGREFYEG
jgi:hypothetical protein